MKTQLQKKLTWLVFAAIVCVSGSPAMAEDSDEVHPFLSSKYSLQLGNFFSTRNTELRVDGSVPADSLDFDFDEKVGFRDSENALTLEFTWRFGEKWSARTQYFSVDRRRSAVLTEDIQWGDNLIEAGSDVTAGTDFQTTRVFFARSFDTDRHVDYGVGIGLHWMEFGAFVKRNVISNPAEVSTVKTSAPLPNIGAWYYYSPSAKWYFGGRLDWFSASIDNYDGSLINIAAGANYQLFNNFGIGLKYQIFELDLNVNESDWHGGVKQSFKGVYVYLSGSWK